MALWDIVYKYRVEAAFALLCLFLESLILVNRYSNLDSGLMYWRHKQVEVKTI